MLEVKRYSSSASWHGGDDRGGRKDRRLAAEHQAVRGNVVIGAFPSAAVGLVVPAIADLSERHPELSCTVREHEPEDGLPLLRSGELDLLVSESYDAVGPAPIGGLESHPLLSEPLLLVLPRDDLAPEPVVLETLSDARWIAGLAGTQFDAVLAAACRSAGFAPHIAHRADDASLLQSLVGSGLGVGLLPPLACSGDGDVRLVHVVPPPPRRHVIALVRRGAARRPAFAAALDALHAAAAVTPARPPAV
jgi:DNA-binding transcriptional LysR family regulator